MRAIIETGGKQFAVAPEDTIRVPSLAGDPGDEVTFDRVLYAADEEVHVGSPAVTGATVTAEIVKHGRGKKIRVFKYKKRKRYSRKKGHRQNFTELRITDISVDRTAAPEAAKKVKAEEPAGPASESGAFVCELCGNAYDTERGLSMHKSRSHKEEE